MPQIPSTRYWENLYEAAKEQTINIEELASLKLTLKELLNCVQLRLNNKDTIQFPELMALKAVTTKLEETLKELEEFEGTFETQLNEIKEVFATEVELGNIKKR